MDIKLSGNSKVIGSLTEVLKRYKLEIFLIILLFMFGFLVMQISKYSTMEPSDQAISEKFKTVTMPKIDEDAIAKIQQLKDQNIEVQSLFENARNNPFSE